MSEQTRWVAKDGTPGHVVITGTQGKLLRVERFSSRGVSLGSELMEQAPTRRGAADRGPRGYRPEAPPAPNARKVHEWGGMVDLEGGGYGNRCKHCHRERRAVDSGGNFMFRVPGGEWERPARTPPCGVAR